MVERVNPQQFMQKVNEAAATSPAGGQPSSFDGEEYRALQEQYATMYMGNVGRNIARQGLTEKHPALMQALEADFQAGRVGRTADGYQGYVALLMGTSDTAIV